MISVEEARQIIDNHIWRKGSESMDVSQASDRILAENVIARIPSPRFDNSAMDGFALRANDIIGASKNNPILLKNMGTSSAGQPFEQTLEVGSCVQCMTGAKIPTGADTVVMVEDTSGFNNDEHVSIYSESVEGKHIRRMGEEIKMADILINKGTNVTTSEIGICASFGYAEIVVAKKPKIAIFSTGNELVEPGNELKEGQIYNSNLPVFADLVKKAGGDVSMKGVIEDKKSSLRSFLDEALCNCDLIISSGGVSMGRYDYVRDVMMDLGVKEHFWKVAQKPGKPFFFGTKGNKLVFGLPGNPVSSYIGFIEWVWPVIREMMGDRKRPPIIGTLTESFKREKTKYRYLFGKAWIEDRKIFCKPSSKLGSHMLTSSLEANCILFSSQGPDMLSPGDSIQINLLPWGILK